MFEDVHSSANSMAILNTRLICPINDGEGNSRNIELDELLELFS